MKPYILIVTLLLFHFSFTMAQEVEPELIETTATVTSLDSKMSGRRANTMANVDYVTLSGDSLSSKVQLMGLPFLGSFKKVGDNVIILYQKDNPYLIKSKDENFLQTYGLYVLIILGLLITGYKFIKRKKTV